MSFCRETKKRCVWGPVEDDRGMRHCIYCRMQDSLTSYLDSIPHNRATKKYVNVLLSSILTPNGKRIWWDLPIGKLDGLTPNECWKKGAKVDVARVAEGYVGIVEYS